MPFVLLRLSHLCPHEMNAIPHHKQLGGILLARESQAKTAPWEYLMRQPPTANGLLSWFGSTGHAADERPQNFALRTQDEEVRVGADLESTLVQTRHPRRVSAGRSYGLR